MLSGTLSPEILPHPAFFGGWDEAMKTAGCSILTPRFVRRGRKPGTDGTLLHFHDHTSPLRLKLAGVMKASEFSGQSECLREVDQVLHLLFREANLEALIVEIHHLLQISRGSVMEIGRTLERTSFRAGVL